MKLCKSSRTAFRKAFRYAVRKSLSQPLARRLSSILSSRALHRRATDNMLALCALRNASGIPKTPYHKISFSLSLSFPLSLSLNN